MTPGLVIFDCDGTLVDSEPLALNLLQGMLRKLGLDLDFAEMVQTFIGKPNPVGFEIAGQMLGRPLPATFAAEYRQRLFEEFQQHLQPIPGVRELVERLNVPLCVASNSGLEHLQLALSLTGLTTFFGDNLFSAALLARGKPAPDVFLHAAKMMNVPPAACVVIEDTPIGVQAAVAAGMLVYGYAALTPAALLRAAGAIVFDKMQDLIPILA